jgi:inorganic triphosphatase YgiF
VELPTADGMAELALDKGVLMGGGKEVPLCEVEVELKSGTEAALIASAAQLVSAHGLQTETHSKFRRAMALTKGE